ncbi:MAG: hypothetical protein HC921_02820 [Synechococcaceae cyanobacterium SM2_3_1]|nr:hypothetical protein [Synechococcaceae cyanobacterium SM2_3_1]
MEKPTTSAVPIAQASSPNASPPDHDPVAIQSEDPVTASADSLSDVSTDAASLQPQRSPSPTISNPGLAVLVPLLLAPDPVAEPEPPTPTFAKGSLAPFPVAQAEAASAPAVVPGVLAPAALTPFRFCSNFPFSNPPCRLRLRPRRTPPHQRSCPVSQPPPISPKNFLYFREWPPLLARNNDLLHLRYPSSLEPRKLQPMPPFC